VRDERGKRPGTRPRGVKGVIADEHYAEGGFGTGAEFKTTI
jgi:hypothetical protein